MEFNRKTAAERLLKLADSLEKQAYENAYFVCDKCNHTADLMTINARRKQAVEGRDDIYLSSSVEINDKLSCAVAGCDGTMSYVATDESARYFVDGADEKKEDEDAPTEGESSGDDDDDIKAEDIFSPVNDSEKTDAPEGDAESEGVGGDIDLTFDEDDTDKGEETVDKPDSEEPVEEKPESVGEEVSESEEEAPAGDEPAEEVPPKKKPKKKDKPDDEKAAVPKGDVPKFEKMPKDASDAYWRSVSRYATA